MKTLRWPFVVLEASKEHIRLCIESASALFIVKSKGRATDPLPRPPFSQTLSIKKWFDGYFVQRS